MKLIRLVITALFFAGACFVIPAGMAKISAVALTVSSESSDSIKVYLGESFRQPAFSERKSSALQKMPEKNAEKLIFRFPSRPATTWIRIDPGENAGVTKIYGMVVRQALGRRLVFTAAEIYDGFSAGRSGVNITLQDDHVEIISTVEDPYLVSVDGFISKPFPIFFLLPIIILTFFLYSFLSKLDKTTLQNIFLPRRQLRDGMTPIAPLDGLRGFAALLVVADHTWAWFLGAGASGVSIFFVLSGFLLSKPFVSNPALLCNVKNLVTFGRRRLQRILPMYYLYLFLTLGLAFGIYDLFLHLFFIEALGHLWAIPQEMLFYTVFPLLIFLNFYVLRSRIWLSIIAISCILLFWHEYVTIKDVYLYGMMHSRLPFRLDVFLVGVLASYLYFGVWEKKFKGRTFGKVTPLLIVVAIVLFSFFLFCSNGFLLHNKLIYAQIYYLYFAFGAGALIFILACSGENFLTKFLSCSFLSSLGVVSYSFYLFHPLVINFVKHVAGGLAANGVIRFVLVTLISYMVACLLFYFIERPLMTIFEKKNK